MSFIPDKMVGMNWRDENSEIKVSEEVEGKSGDEVIDDIRERKILDLD